MSKESCEKCKKDAEELWLWSSKRKDGTEKELWICEFCAKINIKGFEKLKEISDEIDNAK